MQRIVKNSLSLIVMLSLQSMLDLNDEKKENIIDTVKDYINVHYAENITLTEICEKYFYNVSYVSRKFKEVNNCSFEQYLRSVRIERACEMLVSTSKSVFEIAESCGYSSTRSFRKAFSFITGKTPTKFRKM